MGAVLREDNGDMGRRNQCHVLRALGIQDQASGTAKKQHGSVDAVTSLFQQVEYTRGIAPVHKTFPLSSIEEIVSIV